MTDAPPPESQGVHGQPAAAVADFAPYVPRQRDAEVLVLMAPPTWGSRATVWAAWVLGGLSLVAVPVIGYVMITGGKGLVGWIVGAAAIGTLLAVAKAVASATQLEGVSGLRFDADGVTVIEGQGKRSVATWLGRGDVLRLDVTPHAVVAKGRVRAQHLRLHAVQRRGQRVDLGWLRVVDAAASRAAAVELAERIGVPLSEPEGGEGAVELGDG